MSSSRADGHHAANAPGGSLAVKGEGPLTLALSIWLVFALILVPVAIVQSAKGNQVGSSKTMRQLSFGHRFWDPL